MNTVTIQIGNSDDKLSQVQWHNFVQWVDMEVRARSTVHFYGTSPSDASWQNACWVCNVENYDLFSLQRQLRAVKEQFDQNSIAWTVGETEFI